jgi:hypothetical protein
MVKKNVLWKVPVMALVVGLVLVGFVSCSKSRPEDFSIGGEGADGAISGYSGKSKSVVIPAEVDGEAVTRVEAYAFADQTGITSVVIPEGVTSIGDFAFVNCAALKSVTLPASLKTIGDGAFLHCASLVSVKNLPAAVDSEGKPVLDRLGDFAFGGCGKLDKETRTALEELGVPEYDYQIGKAEYSGGIDVTPAARYDPDLRLALPYAGLMSMIGMSYNIVARNLFSQSAMTGEGKTQMRLIAASNQNGMFVGVVGQFYYFEQLGWMPYFELTIAVQSGADGGNYLAYVKYKNLEIGREQVGRWDDIPEISGTDYNRIGLAIGEAAGALFLPITEQGFYDMKKLAAKTNPGVLSAAFLSTQKTR